LGEAEQFTIFELRFAIVVDYFACCFELLLKVPVWARTFTSFLYHPATMKPPITASRQQIADPAR
jgi:hypothetical protein